MINEIITIDVHNMRFIEAKTEIFDSLEGYIKQDFRKFEIIHGYKSGQIMKNYVRFKLKNEFEKNFKKCILTLTANGEGSTTISISII